MNWELLLCVSLFASLSYHIYRPQPNARQVLNPRRRCHCRFGHVAKLLSTLEPYVVLWTTINTFYSSYATWMNEPFYLLNPEQVEAEAAEAYR